MTDLSPAAQAVMDAYLTGYGWLDGPMQKDYQCVAAVLRAAADEVAPAGWTPYQHVRHELLSIAAELEGADAG